MLVLQQHKSVTALGPKAVSDQIVCHLGQLTKQCRIYTYKLMGSSSILILRKAVILNISSLDSNSRGIFLKYSDVLVLSSVLSPDQQPTSRLSTSCFLFIDHRDKNYPLFSHKIILKNGSAVCLSFL